VTDDFERCCTGWNKMMLCSLLRSTVDHYVFSAYSRRKISSAGLQEELSGRQGTAVQIESTRTIDIDQFVPKNEIDERYVDSPSYIAPDGQVGQEAFAVIRETIAKLNMVALGRVVLARREHVIALEPKGRGLVGTTLRYPYEVREEKAYFEDIPELKLPKEMLDLAAHIVETKSGHFNPSQFEDRYENALIDLLKKKQAGEKIEPAREFTPPRVVNLMEALRASVDAEEKKAPAPSTRARRPAKKKANR
jgi:DNA end-binding protein Ku